MSQQNLKFIADVGVPNGLATLDGAGHIPLSQLPASLVEYQGTWDASSNTPTLSNVLGIYNVSGYFFIVSTGGTVDFGAGPITFNASDWVLFNGSIWEKAVQSNTVVSVNGNVGIVTVDAINQLTGDVTTTAASQSQAKATTISQIQGTSITGTTGTGNVALSASPTFTGTIGAAAMTLTGALSASTLSGNGAGITTMNANNFSTGNMVVTRGGTGAASMTLYGIVIGQGTNPVHTTAAGALNSMLIGQGAADPIFSTNPTLSSLGLVGATSGTVTVQPQAVAGTYNFNLPIDAGTSGQYLKSAGGAGAPMTWGNSTGRTPTTQIFTSGSGTYTTPSGVSYIKVRMVGGGGGGGGVTNVPSAAGGGGGAGGYLEVIIDAPSATYSYAVGGGGAGGTTAGTTGTTGVSSTFNGATYTATGGAGGTGVTTNSPKQGGAGGLPTGGDLNARGGAGSTGSSNAGGSGWGGTGGASLFGSGGGGGQNGQFAAIAGVAYGSGGGGGGAAGGAQAGAAGASGVIIVEEY